MNTSTIHKIHSDDGSTLEVEQVNGSVMIKRVCTDGSEGFYIWIGLDEFRAIVDLLKPFASVGLDEALEKYIKPNQTSPTQGHWPYNGYPHPLDVERVNDFPQPPPIWCGAKQ